MKPNHVAPVVDPDKCLRCGRCITDCVSGALAADESGVPGWPDAEAAGRCIGCQHCLAICPVGALSIFGRRPENSAPIGEMPDGEAVLGLIRARRSIRSYRHESLDPALMKQLLDMLSFVPTGVNDHRLQFCVVDRVEVMDEIRRIVSQRMLEFLTSPQLPERFARYTAMAESLRHGGDPFFRGAPHLIVACAPADSPCGTVDSVIALSYFELYARSLGVGTTWCGLAMVALGEVAEFRERLRIPEGYIPGYAMLFGSTPLAYPRSVQPSPYRIVTAG